MTVVEIYFRLHRMGVSQEGIPADIRRNILVREDGSPCLIDFSLAHIKHRCQIQGYPWLTTELRFAPALSCEELHNIVARTDVYEKGEDNIALTILAPLTEVT